MRHAALLLCGMMLGACSVESPLLKPDTLPQQLATGFQFTEGPAFSPDGILYFTDIPRHTIHTWSPSHATGVFNSESEGSNGLAFDAQGRLLACQGSGRRLVRYEKDGSLTVLASHFEGRRFNSPNDLWIHPAGWIYFTDPRYGKRDSMEMKTEGVYLLKPESGEILQLIDDMVRPNGIVGTPDGRFLYIADHGGRSTVKYSLDAQGVPTKKVWSIPRASDGMALDSKGNLYLTDRQVAIYSREGRLLLEIPIPEDPTNVTFGGKDNRTLFITARKSVYVIDMNVSGAHR
ncbi:MAG: SMP-30/gluconolactonase/LRE family protein [Candidatus Methylacidiphilales bacterium]